MTENHFLSHLSPFQINTQLLFFSQNGCRRPFWMTENHFRMYFQNGRRPIPFLAIADQYTTFNFVYKNGCRQLFWITEKSLSIAFLAISDQYTTFIFLTKCLPAAILDDRKSLSIAFRTISDQYATFIFVHKWLRATILVAKIAFGRISHHFKSIRNFFWGIFFHKMAAGGHFR